MIPLSKIIGNVRTKYAAESAVRWSDAAIALAVNEGLEDLSETTRFYERHVSVPVSNLRQYYDLRGWLPENALGVTSVWSTVLNSWLNPAKVSELGSRWERASGPALSFFMAGTYWMGVWPKPATTLGYFRVYFAALAPRFAVPQSVLMDLSDDHVDALEDYALYELSAQDGQTELALLHFSDYGSKAKTLADFVSRRITTSRSLRMGTIRSSGQP